MIGDHKNLLRSFNIYKVFATYNMVLVHGVSIMLGILSPLGFFEEGHSGLSFVRAAFSMTIPAFAGFYFRHVAGPFIGENRLRVPAVRFLTPIIYGAFSIEVLRQLLMKGNIAYSFSWHSLHFCALSALICVLLMKINTRLVALLAILTLLLQGSLKNIWPWIPKVPQEMSANSFLLSSLLWSICFGLVLSGWIWILKKMKLVSGIVFIATAIGAWFFIHEDSRALTTFANLPFAMFFLFPKDQNYWPFMHFFPLFCTGYFLRWFLFDVRFSKWFLPSLLLAGAFVIGGLLSSRPMGIEHSHEHTIHREAFAALPLQVLGLGAFFYLSWVLIYYFTRNRRLKFLDKWVEWTGSVLVVYVIHTSLYVLISWGIRSLRLERISLWEAYFLLHIVYVITLILSYNISRSLPRIQGLFRESARVQRS